MTQTDEEQDALLRMIAQSILEEGDDDLVKSQRHFFISRLIKGGMNVTVLPDKVRRMAAQITQKG